MRSSTVLTGSEELEKYSVYALRSNTITKISNSLNPVKIIPTEEGLLRDWRGLAHLAGIDGETVLSLSCKSDPTAEVFKLWKRNNGQNEIASLGLLRLCLSKMDRWDIVDDTSEMFEQDVKEFIKRQDNADYSASSVGISVDKDILTVDDVCRIERGLQPQNYDAYLLFAEDDVDFAMQIVDKMENSYKLKLCVKDRDLVGGLTFEHEAIMKLIAERCNRLIIVVSPSFLRSEANKFFMKFAQALGIEQRQRKVVPCLYQRCQLPPELSYYFLLDFNRAGKLWNFWEKLRDSIQAPSSTCLSRIDVADVKALSVQQNRGNKIRNVEWDTESPVLMRHNEPPPPYSPSDQVATNVDVYKKGVNIPVIMNYEYGSTSNLEFSKDIHDSRLKIPQSISESNLMELDQFKDKELIKEGYRNNYGSLQSEDTKYKMKPMHWLRRFLPKENKIKEKKKCKRKGVKL